MRTLLLPAAAILLAGSVAAAAGPDRAMATIVMTPAVATTSPVITQVQLDPRSMVAGATGTATLTVTATACVTVQALAVAVRDSQGNQFDPSGVQYDFPGSVNNVQICPSGFTFTTAARSYTAGEYTTYGAYELSNVWHNLTVQPLHVGAAGSTTRPSWQTSGTPVAALDDEFSGSTLNSALWRTGNPYPPPQGTNSAPVNKDGAYAERDCYGPNNVSVSGGYLQLA